MPTHVLCHALEIVLEHVRVARVVQEHVLGVVRVAQVVLVDARLDVIRVVGQIVRMIAHFLAQEIALEVAIVHVRALARGRVNT